MTGTARRQGCGVTMRFRCGRRRRFAGSSVEESDDVRGQLTGRQQAGAHETRLATLVFTEGICVMLEQNSNGV